MQAGLNAGPTIPAAVGIQIGDLAGIDLDNGFGPARLCSTAALARLAQVWVDIQDYVSDHRHTVYSTTKKTCRNGWKLGK